MNNHMKHDKAAWGEGPWLSEPDRKEWVDPATGLTCLILRGPVGALCGYVGVPETHPAYGLHYDGLPDAVAEAESAQVKKRIKIAMKLKEGGADFGAAMAKAWEGAPERSEPVGAGEEVRGLEVHGGLTYAAACKGFICHEPKDGEPDKLWWFGFDCAHCDDLVPSTAAMRKPGGILHHIEARYPGVHEGEVYRDIPYVESECTSLARQLADMTKRLPAPNEAAA